MSMYFRKRSQLRNGYRLFFPYSRGPEACFFGLGRMLLVGIVIMRNDCSLMYH